VGVGVASRNDALLNGRGKKKSERFDDARAKRSAGGVGVVVVFFFVVVVVGAWLVAQ
jgi:hypothetical protein